MSDETSRLRAHPVDRHVGALVRAKRKAIGVSQAQLGDAIGVSFQQIQKYEEGANRLSSSKLFGIAQRLNAPLSCFFIGLSESEADGNGHSKIVDFLDQPGSHELMRAFTEMRPQLRTKFVALAKSLTATDD
jgi:transcriptional regulator with XRE-family HTH domain